MILKLKRRNNRQIIRNLLSMKLPFLRYISLTIITILLIEITRQSLDFNSALYSSLANKPTNRQVNDFFEFQNKW
jgi:hypothetical protein